MGVDFMASTFVDLARREIRCELIYRFLGFKISNAFLFITSAFFSSVSEIVDDTWCTRPTRKLAFSQPTYSCIIKRTSVHSREIQQEQRTMSHSRDKTFRK